MADFSDELLIEAITNFMVVKGCGSTTSGNRIFTFQEIAEHFHITLERVKELEDQIVYSLYSCPQVCEEWCLDIRGRVQHYVLRKLL